MQDSIMIFNEIEVSDILFDIIKIMAYKKNKNEDYGTFAIYGYGKLGQSLYVLMNALDIDVKYIIDNKIKDDSVNIYRSDDALPFVDTIIVAVSKEKNEIIKQMEEKGFEKIIYIKDFIQELITCPIEYK